MSEGDYDGGRKFNRVKVQLNPISGMKQSKSAPPLKVHVIVKTISKASLTYEIDVESKTLRCRRILFAPDPNLTKQYFVLVCLLPSYFQKTNSEGRTILALPIERLIE